MSYQGKFEGWENLTVEDLIVAYRKAKSDCFFENVFPVAIKFEKYEQNLISNLKLLLLELKESEGFGDNEEYLGFCRLLPKKLSVQKKDAQSNGHTYFSDSTRAFDKLKELSELSPEFRIIGDFPVNTHILSALWINCIGHKFDALIGNDSYGTRLKRVKNDEELNRKAPKPFHINAIGSFEPYFQPYQSWRNDGLSIIRTELESEHKIIAASLDLKSYYHKLDPNFFCSEAFLKELKSDTDFSLTLNEIEFTRELVNLLNSWSKSASTYGRDVQPENKSKIPGGLVIGLTASRIVSNILLRKWDILIRKKLTPVHYGRYVDDMFLVIRDPGSITDTDSFMKFLKNRIGSEIISDANKNGIWSINLGIDWQGDSVIELQEDKQKLFILEGRAGLDLLDSIEKEINDLSSEHRLMPEPDQLERSTAARVLSASGKVGEQADTLRRADGLTIKRLSWSLQLRHVETLANDLPAEVWSKERYEFYQFAHDHILRPNAIFSHFQHLPRLLGFAISMKEWPEAEKIVRKSFDAFDELADSSIKQARINGAKCTNTINLLNAAKSALNWLFIDAAARYYPEELQSSSTPEKRVSRLSALLIDILWEHVAASKEIFHVSFNQDEFYESAPKLAIADLARIPYKRHRTAIADNHTKIKKIKKKDQEISQLFENAKLVEVEVIREFISASKAKRIKTGEVENGAVELLMPWLFPTRPLTPSEIAEYAEECVGLGSNKKNSDPPEVIWARYVRAIRGVWVKPSLTNPSDPQNKSKRKKKAAPVVKLGGKQEKSIIIAITNIKTEDSSWEASICGSPDLSLERYSRLSKLINQALQVKPKPNYLILPELSLPIKWVNSISNRLLGSGISLIAGTEYRHQRKNVLYSEALLALTDNRLGYSSSVKIWQPKLLPAPGEEEDLFKRFGKKWESFPKLKKPVYDHNGLNFGIMICSELQNSKQRTAFQGKIDALMVLAWNRDLDTFSALVEASALDIHSYIILVNNRMYGDSRVRSPAKESFHRDLARVQGGENDYCISVQIDIAKLRAFQSRAKRWPTGGAFYKPVPEGFILPKRRRKNPPK